MNSTEESKEELETFGLSAFRPQHMEIKDPDKPKEQKYRQPRLWYYQDPTKKQHTDEKLKGRRVFYSVKKRIRRDAKESESNEDRKELLRKYIVPPHLRANNPY